MTRPFLVALNKIYLSIFILDSEFYHSKYHLIGNVSAHSSCVVVLPYVSQALSCILEEYAQVSAQIIVSFL